MTPRPTARTMKLVTAAENADWVQVVLNGGPPCFHLEGERFCLRAYRWAGHDPESRHHRFVSLAGLITTVERTESPRPGRGKGKKR